MFRHYPQSSAPSQTVDRLLPSRVRCAKRFRTTTGNLLQMGLNRASITSSVASLRPYTERKSTSPTPDVPRMESKKPQSGNEYLVGQHISSWEDLNWNVSPIRKVDASLPSAHPTHERTLSLPMPFDPPPVSHPPHSPKNGVASDSKSAKNSPEMKTPKLRPDTPSDGNQSPQVPTSTFGQRPNKISRSGPSSSDGPAPPPVSIRSHSKNQSSLDSNKLFGIPMRLRPRLSWDCEERWEA